MHLMGMRGTFVAAAWFAALTLALLLTPLSVQAAAAQGPARVQQARAGYDYYAVGDVNAKTPGKTSGSLLLAGGGHLADIAFQWFVAEAGYGHIVILAASGGDEWQDWTYRDIGGVASVQTLVFHSRAPASDPEVLAIIKRADGIFIAGGNQANYVHFWKDTAVADLLNAHVRAGKPIGGTSAGLAILGKWGYGALDNGSITSNEALRDPAGRAVGLVDEFLTLPQLASTITDTHFVQRQRLGRLLAFVARLAHDRHTAFVTGLGVDQDSALLVEANGSARFVSRHPDGHAWVVVPAMMHEVETTGGRPALDAYLKGRLVRGKPLDLPGFVVTGVGADSRLQLPSFRVTDPAFEMDVDVSRGQLVRRVTQGQAPDSITE